MSFRFANKVLVPMGFVALALAGPASFAAETTTAPVANNNGLMTFPHSRVETAPAAQTATPVAPSSGMTAFIDPATGQFVAPTAESAAALAAAAAPAKTRTRAATAPRTLTLAKGGEGLMLDDSNMSYFVARKTTSGKLVTDCVPGSAVAQATLKQRDVRTGKLVVKETVK